MRFFSFFLLVLTLIFVGCARKPAPDNTNRQIANPQSQTNGEQSGQATAAGSASQPQQPAQPEKPKFRMPSFIDQINGGAKDIPTYPNTKMITINYGQGQPGYDTMDLMVQSADSTEKITQFYEKAFKTHGWKVVDSVKGPVHIEWRLMKDENNEGTVILQKDPATNLITMRIVRAEKISDTKQ